MQRSVILSFYGGWIKDCCVGFLHKKQHSHDACMRVAATTILSSALTMVDVNRYVRCLRKDGLLYNEATEAMSV